MSFFINIYMLLEVAIFMPLILSWAVFCVIPTYDHLKINLITTIFVVPILLTCNAEEIKLLKMEKQLQKQSESKIFKQMLEKGLLDNKKAHTEGLE